MSWIRSRGARVLPDQAVQRAELLLDQRDLSLVQTLLERCLAARLAG